MVDLKDQPSVAWFEAYHGLCHQWEAEEFGRHADLVAWMIQHMTWIAKEEVQKVLARLIQFMEESAYMSWPCFRFRIPLAEPYFHWLRSNVIHHSYPYDEEFHQSQSTGMICLNHKALELVQQKIEQTRISCCFLDNVKIQISSGFHWMLYNQLQSLRISTIQLSYNRGMKAWWIICSSKL